MPQNIVDYFGHINVVKLAYGVIWNMSVYNVNTERYFVTCTLQFWIKSIKKSFQM
jgi:hypothetical protein